MHSKGLNVSGKNQFEFPYGAAHHFTTLLTNPGVNTLILPAIPNQRYVVDWAQLILGGDVSAGVITNASFFIDTVPAVGDTLYLTAVRIPTAAAPVFGALYSGSFVSYAPFGVRFAVGLPLYFQNDSGGGFTGNMTIAVGYHMEA